MLEQTVTTGTTDIQVALTNTGAVSVQTGTLEFDGGGTSTAGTFTVASGATLDFNAGTFTLSGGSIGGAGAVAVTGGTLAIGASFTDSANLNLSTTGAGVLALDGYTLTLAGASNALTGAVNGAGILKVTGAATLTNLTAGAAGSLVTIDDTGSATLAGSDTLTGALQIDAGATATVSGTLSAGASVNFNGASATLSLGSPGELHGHDRWRRLRRHHLSQGNHRHRRHAQRLEPGRGEERHHDQRHVAIVGEQFGLRLRHPGRHRRHEHRRAAENRDGRAIPSGPDAI